MKKWYTLQRCLRECKKSFKLIYIQWQVLKIEFIYKVYFMVTNALLC